ncbi:hypothetical protein [Chryseobacterium sp. MFBS3-17]|uniref:hypothetical protein n=1 Tax=Chryseobacterium sp. MFBS3-17 TaxID=2886689 RepID=UPI001D0EE81B|nr:hypothetical protein [Chryseobacterium sp. MFBS3-17]MCC2590145.1 hypothetical protein [Chryseobacterium sp. MFBS3-17]
MKNSLKNKLKTEYEHLSETPAPDLWERIEAEMNQQEEIGTAPVVRRNNGFWKVAAVILLLVSIGLFTRMMLEGETNLAAGTESTIASIGEPGAAGTSQVPVGQEVPQIVAVIPVDRPERETDPEIALSPAPAVVVSQKPLPAIPTENSALQSLPETVKEEQTMVAAVKNVIPKSNSTYITADELLFVREVHQRSEVLHNESRLVEIDLSKLERRQSTGTIKIFGITVFDGEDH